MTEKYSCKGWLYFILLWVKILEIVIPAETVKVVLQYGADEIGYNNIVIFVAKKAITVLKMFCPV